MTLIGYEPRRTETLFDGSLSKDIFYVFVALGKQLYNLAESILPHSFEDWFLYIRNRIPAGFYFRAHIGIVFYIEQKKGGQFGLRRSHLFFNSDRRGCGIDSVLSSPETTAGYYDSF